MDARRKALDERESALLARERTQGAIKEETRRTVFKQDGPQLAKNVVNTTREVILSSTLQQDTPDLRAPVSELSPVRKCSNEVISEQSLTVVTPAKNEPVGMDLNGAHDVQCGHGYDAGEFIVSISLYFVDQTFVLFLSLWSLFKIIVGLPLCLKGFDLQNTAI